LTGDSSAVAGYVGQQVGLIKDVTQIMHGRIFAELSDQQKKEAVEKYTVFARINPMQKHEIIQLLQANGHTVGFVGDGINDAPALKQAHVALTVSGASDIAQDAADIILLHRSLSTIVSGIQEGRIIFANVMKYLRLTLSSTFGNFFTVALASLVTAQLPMLPIQILLLNLLSDLPMIGIASDKVDPEELSRPIPQDMNRLLRVLIAFGLLSTAFDLFFFMLFFTKPIAVLQTGWFIFSVLTELVFLFAIRTKRSVWKSSLPSSLLLLLTVLAAIITVLLPFSVVGMIVFHFQALPVTEVLLIVGLAMFYLFSNEVLKRVPFLRSALSR
jgi:Mg2+-importing ATPase